MITFLFWNINKKPLLNFIVQLVNEHNVDVLILAESNVTDYNLLKHLNKQRAAVFFPDVALPKRLRIYTKYLPKHVKLISDSAYMSFRHLELPLYEPLLVGSLHLPSKSFHSETDQVLDCTTYLSEVRKAEANVGHARTILVGDFNMNPFEQGIVAASGFHAIMDRRLVQKDHRTVQGNKYQFFYNPMWNYFGDKAPNPTGTYYYDKGTQVNYYWHIFDQVLIKPELLDEFNNDDLEILTKVDSISLLDDSGKPDLNIGSDHLPIVFKIYLKRRIQ